MALDIDLQVTHLPCNRVPPLLQLLASSFILIQVQYLGQIRIGQALHLLLYARLPLCADSRVGPVRLGEASAHRGLEPVPPQSAEDASARDKRPARPVHRVALRELCGPDISPHAASLASGVAHCTHSR